MPFSRRVGLAAMMICTLLPIALSATGSRLVVVTGAVFVCLPLLLASALAWTGRRPGRQVPRQTRALREKRIVVLLCLLAVALIPVTWWPLRLAFALSRPAVSRLGAKYLQEGIRDRSNISYWSCFYGRYLDDNYPATEDMHVVAGTFALRKMIPLSSLQTKLEIQALGGSTSFICYPNATKHVSPSGGINLGGGWWFVSY